MPHAIVLQPNGLYAVWSSVVDNFAALNLMRDEVIQFEMDSGWGDYPGGLAQKRKAIESEFINIEKSGVAFDWAKDWNECVGWLKKHAPGMIAEIEVKGIPLEMERRHTDLEYEHYWRIYWRNRCHQLEAELSSARNA